MKDKKGSGKVIAQSVCNISDFAYMPEKGKNVFESKVSLKIHKAYSFANLLKPNATLNLGVKSLLRAESSENDLGAKTAVKTVDHRRYLSNASETFVFDFDDTINNCESILFDNDSEVDYNFGDDFSISSSINGSEKKQNRGAKTQRVLGGDNSNFRSVQLEIMEDFQKRISDLDQSRNIGQSEFKQATLESNRFSQDTLNRYAYFFNLNLAQTIA